MNNEPNDNRVIIEREHAPVIVERRSSVAAVIATLLLVAVIAVAVWFFFIADSDTRDAIVPDGIDVTVDN
ncbi:MAG TPA: hypothetical protein VLA29_10600 [Acidimicrobiia bacterium]|nr:hypothetical protein [Acidimicrobiia bacterium]